MSLFMYVFIHYFPLENVNKYGFFKIFPKIDFATIAVKIFWDFLIFYEICQLPQVKPRVVISIENGL